jgi:3-hydroxyisobutyrate dehydrogenase-like beta-hydroxyacid dehydrogenase
LALLILAQPDYGKGGKMQIGFVGLGDMGSGMARNLLKAGHSLTVFNRTSERVRPFEALGARPAISPAEAACEAEILVTMLADDRALEEVIFDSVSGGLSALKPGSIHLSMSTISVEISRRLAKAHTERNQHFVSAPVFGRPQTAAAQKLWIVATGCKAHLDRCQPLFEAMGRGFSVVGEEPWQANLLKLAGNFMIASMVEAFGEAFALQRKSGLNPRQFLEVMNGSLFQSPIYELYGG